MENKPALILASHGMLFNCFMTLHMMRTSNGFGPNPITLGEIKDYLALFGQLPVDMDLLIRLLKQCDEAALAWQQEKAKPKEPTR